MATDNEAKMLKEAVELLGPRSPSRRFPPELKARILEWVDVRERAGATPLELEDAISVPWQSIGNWRRKASKNPGDGGSIRPVQLIDGPNRQSSKSTATAQRHVRGLSNEAPRMVLRIPGGFEVEFADVTMLVDVLKRLG